MKTLLKWFALFPVLMTFIGCGSGEGPDSISSHKPLKGGVISSCLQCHSSAISASLDPLVTNGTGTAGKHVRHVSSLGIACERCHLNYESRPTHASGVLDSGNPSVLVVYFDSINSSGVWTNDTGPHTGQCSSLACHGTDTPDWYGTGWVLPACSICHANAIAARRVVVGAAGDFYSNSSITSRHVTTASDPTPDQCRVCHDLSTHGAGTVRLKNADTGAVISYSTPSSAEPFCLSCHDPDGALNTFISGGTPTSPFNDGKVLGAVPYKMSAEIKTHWEKVYGHKQQGLTCIGDGSPNTGCHSNAHGSAYVGLLAKNLTLPNPGPGPYTVADEIHYELCFSCHAIYPTVSKEAILGVRQGSNYDWDHYWFDTSKPDWWNYPYSPPYYDNVNGIQTKFRDRHDASGKYYSDTIDGTNYVNLHWYHLEEAAPDSGWRYRDSIGSSTHCLTCHNVHGSNTPWGWVYDELLFIHGAAGSDEYGMMNYSNITALANAMDNYPVSCVYSCHREDYYGNFPYNSWFEPSNECYNLPCSQCSGTGCI